MDLNSSINSIVNFLDGTYFVSLFRNPIWVAILITIILLLIVVLIYNEKRLIKTGVYMFFASLIIVFLHNQILLKEHKRKLCSADQQSICNNIDNMTGGFAAVPRFNIQQSATQPATQPEGVQQPTNNTAPKLDYLME